MLPVVDKPLIQYAVEEARAAGHRAVLHGHRPRQDRADRSFRRRVRAGSQRCASAARPSCSRLLDAMKIPPGAITTVRQQVPMGLGHAIWCARAFIGDEPFAILLPDDLVLQRDALPQANRRRLCRDRRQRRRRHRGAARAHQPLRHPRDRRRRRPAVEVTGLVEKPKPEEAPCNLSIIGRYILMPEVIESCPAWSAAPATRSS